jgi:hypothetical protein
LESGLRVRKVQKKKNSEIERGEGRKIALSSSANETNMPSLQSPLLESTQIAENMRLRETSK